MIPDRKWHEARRHAQGDRAGQGREKGTPCPGTGGSRARRDPGARPARAPGPRDKARRTRRDSRAGPGRAARGRLRAAGAGRGRYTTPTVRAGTSPRRTAMKRIGSISRLTDPPCGMTKSLSSPSAAASATAIDISAMAVVLQCAGLAFVRRDSAPLMPGGDGGGVEGCAKPGHRSPFAGITQQRPNGRRHPRGWSGSARRR